MKIILDKTRFNGESRHIRYDKMYTRYCEKYEQIYYEFFILGDLYNEYHDYNDDYGEYAL